MELTLTDGGFYDAEKRRIVTDFMKRNQITRAAISDWAPYFPDKAMRTMIESEVIYSVAP